MGVLQRKILEYCTGSVKHYCETCPACMKKNPITQAAKGSRKPIRSRRYRDRFQFDLIDFRKLRKRDPFGVLMRTRGHRRLLHVQYLGGSERNGLHNYCTSILDHFCGGAIILDGKTVDDRGHTTSQNCRPTHLPYDPT